VTGGVGASALPAGTAVSAFVLGSDRAVWWRQYVNGNWTAWQSFGGVAAGQPAGTAGPGGTAYMFVRGADNALWWQGYDGTRWSGWNSFGGVLSGDPAVIADSNGVSVFVRGGDGAMYFGSIDASRHWSGWRGAGGVLASGIGLAQSGSTVYAFVVGNDSSAYVQSFTNGIGSGFGGLGGVVTTAPTAVTDNAGLAVYVRGGDGALYRRVLSGGNFLPWQPLGGYLMSPPNATGWGDTTYVFARGGDLRGYVQRIVGGVPGGWQAIGGSFTSGVVGLADANGVTVFGRGGDLYLYSQRSEGTWPGWGQLPAVIVLIGPSVALTAPITAGPQGPATGAAFDTCETPSSSAMATWRLYSPYTSVGIYIGGVNRACANTALNSNTWVNTVVAQGWRLIPIYVGLQAPCINFSSQVMSRDPAAAYQQGGGAANDAMSRAAIAGLPPGSPIYFDMEGYNNADAGCVAAVRAFVNGWVAQLHVGGFKAAMYSSLCSGIVDQAAVYDTPGYNRLDAIWLAAWAYSNQDDPAYATYVPNLFGFTGCGAPLLDSMWSYHQRLRQYRGGHNETYAGVTISVDSNAVDGPLAP
jgi:hypothetical protein